MPFCPNCGNENPAGTRFCSKCGTEQVAIEANCPNCGRLLAENEKFCSGCGAPLSARPAGNEAQTVKPEPVKKEGKFTKEGRKIIDAGPKPNPSKANRTIPPTSVTPPHQKKKRGCLGKSILILLILLVVSVVIIWNLPDEKGVNTRNETEVLSPENKATKKTTIKHSKPNFKSKSTLVETTVNTDTSEVTIKATDNISVVLPIALLPKEEKLVVKELKPVQLPNGQKSDIVIDVSLGNEHQFDDFIEILVTPPANFSSQDNIQCLSMSEGDKNWQPIMAFYEPEINKIRIVTDHLSSFAVGVIKYNGTNLVIAPMYTVANETYKYFKTIASHDAVSILKGYDAERVSKTLNKDYHILSWNTVMDVYGLAGTGLSFMENGVGMSGLSKIGEAAGNIGIGLSVIQIALDAYNGKVEAAQVGIYKTFLNTIVSKGFNTRAMNLALIGVFAIDYSLTTFANEAWAGRKALYETIWDNYQKRQRKKKINLYWWKKQIVVGMRKANDPSKFESVVEGIIAKYIADFWNDETEIALIQSEVGPIFSAGGGLNKKMKDELSADFRLQILQYTQSLLQSLQKQYIYKARKELSLQRAALAKELNREQLIRCEVVLDKDEKPDKYEQLKVAFEVSGKEMIKMWQGVLNKDAKMNFYCTAAGYIGAGAPNHATLYIPNANDKNKDDEIKAAFNMLPAGKTTVVQFKKEQSKIQEAGISINFDGKVKERSSTGTSFFEMPHNISSGLSFKDARVVGNSITASGKYKDGGDVNVTITLVFENINDPVKLKKFAIEMTQKGPNNYYSEEAFTGSNVPFEVTKYENNTTIDFRYGGDIVKYKDKFKYLWKDNYGTARTCEYIELKNTGTIQVVIKTESN